MTEAAKQKAIRKLEIAIAKATRAWAMSRDDAERASLVETIEAMRCEWHSLDKWTTTSHHATLNN